MRTRLLHLLPLVVLPALAGSQRPAAPSLDTVRVTSRASAAASATRSVEVIGREELERHAARSLAELLGFALGTDVQVRSPAQADIAIRGSTVNQVVVLVDGVRVSDVQSGHYALDLAVPTAMIERIEIMRGASSALYGSDAVGGVVNIVTRTDTSGASLAARGGSFGGASASAASFGRAGPVGLRAAADVDRSDGHRPGTDYRVAQWRASADRATPAGRVVADVGEGVRHFGAADFYSPFPSDETTRSTTAAVRLVPEGDDARITMGGSLHLRRHTDVFTLVRTDPARYQNEHTSVEAGGDATARVALAPAVVAAFGADLLDARLRSARLGDHVQRRTGGFAELSAGSARRALLDVALRGDQLSDEGGFVSPSVAIAVALAPAMQLRGSITRGFRAPTWTERYYVDPANIADSSLAVERFWSHEVGLRGLLPGGVAADVAVYQRAATDLIDWAKPDTAAASAPWRTRNFASATYRGVEGALHLPTLANVDWTLRGAGLRFDAATASGTIGKYALRPITRSVGVSGATTLGASVLATLDARQERRAGEPGHLQLDARVSAPVRDLRFSLELVNLTGADYLDGSGKPVAGRSAFAGVRWER